MEGRSLLLFSASTTSTTSTITTTTLYEIQVLSPSDIESDCKQPVIAGLTITTIGYGILQTLAFYIIFAKMVNKFLVPKQPEKPSTSTKNTQQAQQNPVDGRIPTESDPLFEPPAMSTFFQGSPYFNPNALPPPIQGPENFMHGIYPNEFISNGQPSMQDPSFPPLSPPSFADDVSYELKTGTEA
ncbi:unnamed protein product [Didymodactylos carnosus]|uniref:Uncharacterized protein n=1 Tax=Didymodactylos carnosus TaxID=1234261 RepID=A0A815IE82_9BILA|nr:unnamed protein product [Didymodactylos carnosus]CAF4245179.1 unnamed protein product [Didymodactylos carnosus]